MIDSGRTFQIIERAKDHANDSVRGGLEKKLNDMQNYLQTGVSSGVSFLISKIPLVGSELSTAFNFASSIGISKLYEKLLSEARTSEERIGYALFLLESSLCKSIRQSYNTVASYDKKMEIAVDCGDCQDAFREAYAAHLAQSCIEDLEAAGKILSQLVKDLESETEALKSHANDRVSNIRSRIDDFRDNHPQESCMGLQACYWEKGPPTPFSSIGNDQL